MTASRTTHMPSLVAQSGSGDAVPGSKLRQRITGEREITRSEADRASKKVIAAVADDPVARVVLSAAAAIANLYAATVQAVHVGEDHPGLTAAVQGAGVTLTTIAGPLVETLARAAAAEEVAAVVIGARGAPVGRRPAGRTALRLITVLQKPVVVVPPAAAPGLRIENVLVPLDGTIASAAALHETVALARGAAAEITVAHVQRRDSIPPFQDHAPHEVDAWSSEFINHYCPWATTLELRVEDGQPPEHVLDILRRSRCDLVALGWGQELAGGRAAVVRQMLAESPVPVLLAPVSGASAFALPGTAPAADSADRELA
jgi:nucleotide-binding universal stress UspA family protein